MPYDLCSSGEVGAICHGGRVTLLSQLVGEHSRRSAVCRVLLRTELL